MTPIDTKNGERKTPGQILFKCDPVAMGHGRVWSEETPERQKSYEDVSADFLAAMGAQVVHWIPVGERLPEDEGFYPVAGAEEDGYYFTGNACFNGTLREWECEEEVTHWAEPLKHPEAQP